jgi:hypothetical protein
MGNQQVSELEIGWLAGAFDADGHVFMVVYPTKRGAWKNYRIEVGFTNTDECFLAKVCDICARLKSNLHIQAKSRKKSYWSPAWTARAGKISHCKRILEAITPYLTVKKEKAELLLAFCNRRLSLASTYCSGNMNRMARAFPYTDEDLWYFEQFALKHRARPTPTTIPEGSRAQEGPKRRAQAA